MAKIRLWKLGSLEHKIVPTQAAALKLAKILSDARASAMDIFDVIWDDTVTVETIDGDNDVLLADDACITYLESRGYTIKAPDAK